MKKVAHRSHWSRPLIAVLLVAVGFGGVFVALAALYPLRAPASAPPATPEQQQEEEAAPPYSVFSQTPQLLRIASLGIEAPITTVGLTTTGAMDAPQTLTEVGWYSRSANLGQMTTHSILMDGHYGSDWAPGIFYNLHELQLDDTIELVGEDGGTAVYHVAEIEKKALEDVDMRRALQVYPDALQSLTLITCEGQYDSGRQTYNDRTVVYAVRVG